MSSWAKDIATRNDRVWIFLNRNIRIVSLHTVRTQRALINIFIRRDCLILKSKSPFTEENFVVGLRINDVKIQYTRRTKVKHSPYKSRSRNRNKNECTSSVMILPVQQCTFNSWRIIWNYTWQINFSKIDSLNAILCTNSPLNTCTQRRNVLEGGKKKKREEKNRKRNEASIITDKQLDPTNW